MAYINKIATATPRYEYPQMDLCDYMHRQHPDIDPKKIDLIYAKSSIRKRYSILPDFKSGYTDPVLFKTGDAPDIQQRMGLYKKEAVALGQSVGEKVIEGDTSKVTHLIAVSCTGLSAPGLDFELVRKMGLPSHIERYAVNFMGCFAAFHALKMADTICKAYPDAQVLVVCVELCTIHIHKGSDLESVVANAIFADGAAACLVSNQASGLKIHQFIQDIVPSSDQEMAWDLTTNHFLMKLSSYVPSLIQDNLEHFATKISQFSVDHHAVHPGGRRILEAYQQTMGIERERLSCSYEVLESYGNMSSPTILFVLEKLMDSEKKGSIFASGFGPGLTMEGMLLEKS